MFFHLNLSEVEIKFDTLFATVHFFPVLLPHYKTEMDENKASI